MKKNIFAKTGLGTITLMAALVIIAGCQRRPAPAAPPAANPPAPPVQITPSASPRPTPTADPALLNDGLDDALKDLDAVE